MVDVTKPTKEEIAEGLKLLQQKLKRQERIKSGELKGQVKMSELKELNPALYKKRQMQAKRNAMRMHILVEKARAAGITVSQEEIDAKMTA